MDSRPVILTLRLAFARSGLKALRKSEGSKGALMVLLVLAACNTGTSSHSGGAPKTAEVGKPAPQWSEPLINGKTLTMSSLVGKPVYLNFFASWCTPCNAEAPDVNAVQREFASRGLRVIGVDVLESSKKAKSFVDQHHVIFPVVVDSGTLRDEYQINGMPVHAFIDAHGIVRKIAVGELSKSQMEADVRAIL
jgi:cytochrome c biogenesis protein CcmG/thiol:disulfide interchange protein DsbE